MTGRPPSAIVLNMARAMRCSKAWPAVFEAGSSVALATAALEALLDPTPEMLAAMRHADSPNEVPFTVCRKQWEAAIRAALDPEETR